MAINWFEGGRRISKLLMALVALGGAASVIFSKEPTPTLTKRAPETPWFVSGKGCDYPSYQRMLSDYDWGGEKAGLALCFSAMDNGKIPYQVAPTPPDEFAKERARLASGGPPPLWQTPWYYTGFSYDPRVEAYIDDNVASLKITAEMQQEIEDTGWRWPAYKQAVNDALPWVVGLLTIIWIFTFTMGWIIRGFTGVPQGQDFKLSGGG